MKLFKRPKAAPPGRPRLRWLVLLMLAPGAVRAAAPATGADGPRTRPAGPAQAEPTPGDSRDAEDRADRTITEIGLHHGVFLTRGGWWGGGRITRVSITGWNRDVLAQLKLLRSLRSVGVCSLEIPDDGVRELSDLAGLESLDLAGPLTDEGAKALRGLKRLKELHLSSAEITDEGLKSLGEIATLETLRLWRCRDITDAGLAAFARSAGFEVVAESRASGANAETKTLRRRTV